ncbi:MAG: HEAT repeat domain-containing protein [Anaerolineae bacterium]|nr:HEAT repeat domain-containing protein [Anaerolineae bacterium]
MRESFAEALEGVRQQAEGWLKESNLRQLSAATAEEVHAFATVWSDLEADRRFQLITALAGLAEESRELSFEPLFEVTLEDDIAEVRSTAVAGLWEVSDNRLAEKVLGLLRDDPDAGVRAEAATALGTFLATSEPEGDSAGLRQRVEDALLEAINTDTEDVLVRRRAIESYGYADDPYVDEILMDAYDSDEDEMVASAIFAMGRRLDERWLGIIHRELSSEVDEIRLAAIYAASEIGSGASVPYLLRIIGEDPSDDMRVAAVYGLAEIEAPEAARILEDLLESEDVAVQVAADDALDLWQSRDDLSDMVMFDYGPPREEGHSGNGRDSG